MIEIRHLEQVKLILEVILTPQAFREFMADLEAMQSENVKLTVKRP